MSSLINAVQAKIASDASVTYLVTLIEERYDAPVDQARFASMSQSDVSDMIERALLRPCLDASPEQLAQVAELAETLGRGTLVTKDRGQASRQIRAMQADLEARANSKRVITDERADAADSFLDGLFPAPAAVETDEIPF